MKKEKTPESGEQSEGQPVDLIESIRRARRAAKEVRDLLQLEAVD